MDGHPSLGQITHRIHGFLNGFVLTTAILCHRDGAWVFGLPGL